MTGAVVSIAQQKGGAGKTTLAIQLGVAWLRHGPAGRDARHRPAGEPVHLVQPAPPAAGRRRRAVLWCRGSRAGGSAASSVGCGASSIWSWSTARRMPRPTPAARSGRPTSCCCRASPTRSTCGHLRPRSISRKPPAPTALLVLNRVPARGPRGRGDPRPRSKASAGRSPPRASAIARRSRPRSARGGGSPRPRPAARRARRSRRWRRRCSARLAR